MIKRIIHYATLVAALIFCASNAYALSGSGTKAEPYIIGNYEDLNTFNTNITSNGTKNIYRGNFIYVELGADIDCGGKILNPMGGIYSATMNLMSQQNDDYNFTGEFDGKGHTIKNFTISANSPRTNGQSNISTLYIVWGLFGKVGNATSATSAVKNLTLEDYTIAASHSTGNFVCAGGVVGYALNATITNCHVKNCTITKLDESGQNKVGGLCGLLCDGAKLTKCTVDGLEVKDGGSAGGGTSIVGGLLGGTITRTKQETGESIEMSQIMSECYAVNCTLNKKGASGIVGVHNRGKIEYCGFNGVVGSSTGVMQNAGGLCGKMNGGSISNCYSVCETNSPKVSTLQTYGVVVGTSDVDDAMSDGTPSIENCYVAVNGKCTASGTNNSYVGELCATGGDNITVKNVYIQSDSFVVTPTTGARNIDEEFKKEYDVMSSGCLAELLNKYVDENPNAFKWNPESYGLSAGVKMWQEDMTGENGDYPVLAMQLGDNAGEDVFCGPKVRTADFDRYTIYESKATLGGSIKFLLDQKPADWVFGIEYTSGGVLKKYTTSDAAFLYDATKGTFKVTDAAVDEESANYFRAFVTGPINEASQRTKYGITDTVFVGKPSFPKQPEPACDSVKFTWKGVTTWYKKDATLTDLLDEAGNPIKIKIKGYTDTINYVTQAKPNPLTDEKLRPCGNSFIWNAFTTDNVYTEEGVHIRQGVNNEAGCPRFLYIDLKFDLPENTDDSVYVVKTTDKVVKFADQEVELSNDFFKEFCTTKEAYKAKTNAPIKNGDNLYQIEEYYTEGYANYPESGTKCRKSFREYWIANGVKVTQTDTSACTMLNGEENESKGQGEAVPVTDAVTLAAYTNEIVKELYERCDTTYHPYVLERKSNSEERKYCVGDTYTDPLCDADAGNECATYSEDMTFYKITYYPASGPLNCPQYVDTIKYVGGEKKKVLKKDTVCLEEGKDLIITPTIKILAADVKSVEDGVNSGFDVTSSSEGCDGKSYNTYEVSVFRPKPALRDTVHGLEQAIYPKTKINAAEDVVVTKEGKSEQTFEYLEEAGDVCMREKIVTFEVHKKEAERKETPMGCDSVAYEREDDGETVWVKHGDESFRYTLTKHCEWENKDWEYEEIVVTSENVYKSRNETSTRYLCNAQTVKLDDDGDDKVDIVKDTIIYRVEDNGVCVDSFTYIFKVGESGVDTTYVPWCNGSYVTEGGKEISVDGFVADTIVAGDCQMVHVYEVKFISPLISYDTLYGCMSYDYTYNDGKKETITESKLITEKIPSVENSNCTEEIWYKTIVIGQPSVSVVDDLGKVCGSYQYFSHKQNKNITISETKSFEDTIITKCGCDSVLRYKVTIENVEITYDTVSVCGKYVAPGPVWVNGEEKHEYTFGEATKTDSSLKEATVAIVTKKVDTECFDTLYRHIISHGVKVSDLPDVHGCDVFEYTKMNGATVSITKDTIVRDTLRSQMAGCECDSLIHNFKVTVGKSTEEVTVGAPMIGCDTVYKFSPSGVLKKVTESGVLVDTFRNVSGCDSLVSVAVTVNYSTRDTVFHPNSCGAFEYVAEGSQKTLVITKDTAWREETLKDGAVCPHYVHHIVKVIPKREKDTIITVCGDTIINDVKYEQTESVAKYQLTKEYLKVEPETPEFVCDTQIILNRSLYVYPEYMTPTDTMLKHCTEVLWRNIKYTRDTVFVDTFKIVGGCDSLVRVSIKMLAEHKDTVVVNKPVGCIKEDQLSDVLDKYDPVFVDTFDTYGCGYTMKRIFSDVIPPTYGDTLTLRVRRKYKDEYADFSLSHWDSENKILSNDSYSIVNDTLVKQVLKSNMNCDSIRIVDVRINNPVMDTILIIDSCMSCTYYDRVNDVEIVTKEKLLVFDTLEIVPHAMSDSFDLVKFVYLNVEQCFPYPVLVDKYGWLLICNDNIMEEDKFKWGQGARYRWYKNDAVVSETKDNYYSEQKMLEGCYKVGVVTKEGQEFESDELCFESGNSFSLRPAVVDKGMKVIVTLNMMDGNVLDATMDVYNASAMKLIADRKFLGPDLSIDTSTLTGVGTYFVKVTTGDKKVFVSKFVVK